MEDKESRRRALEEALEKHGLSFREDSRLCMQHVAFGAGDPEEIADIMNEMEFFVKKTGYARAFRVVRRENFPYDIDRDWNSVLAKRRALRWLVRDGDEETLAAAPESLAGDIEFARKIVEKYPVRAS
jgi:hypothetical protein